MKLQGVRDGRVYATRGRTVYVDDTGTATQFERLSDLPFQRPRVVAAGTVVEQAVSARPWKGLLGRVVGRYATTNLWPVGGDVLVATVGRRVFVSHDAGTSWSPTLDLPASSGAAGVLPTGVCAQDGTIYLGEYPLDDGTTPRVLASDDDGLSWRSVLELPDVRHVHGVHADPYTDDIWVTTGDADAACRIGQLRDGRLDVVGAGSQTWRAVALLFTPDAIFWGMDCPYVQQNAILRLDRRAISEDGADAPTPTVLHAVPNSVYYGTTVSVGGTDWAVFSTAAEAGPDSSAPDRETTGNDEARVVASPATSDFRTWYDLCSFRRRGGPTDRVDLGGRLPRANAYVFLAGTLDGLLVNPYNATPHDGSIVTVGADRFQRLSRAPTPG